MSKSESEIFINDLLDNLEDPIVSKTGSFGYLGFVESLILNSLFSEFYKEHLLNKIETMRKSEMDLMVIELKQNQFITDPRHQFERMAKAGVFTSFKDQN